MAKAVAWQFTQESTAWFIGDYFNIVAPETGLRTEYLLILTFMTLLCKARLLIS